MGATLASTILGFVREVVYAKFFGTSWELDAFLAASVVPVILFGVFNGALVTALVPLFTDYVNTEREDEAWRLASTVIVVLVAVLGAAAALGAWLAPWYVPRIARFPAAHVQTAVTMTRWLMPTIVATSLAGVIGSLLNAYHRFGAAALQGFVANLCIIVFVWFAQPHYGAYALVFGALAGAFVSLLALLPTFLSLRRFRFALDLHHPGLARLMHVLGPIAIGSAAGPDRAVLRPLLRLGDERRDDRRDELRGQDRRVSAADLRDRDRDGHLPALRKPVRPPEPSRDAP